MLFAKQAIVYIGKELHGKLSAKLPPGCNHLFQFIGEKKRLLKQFVIAD